MVMKIGPYVTRSVVTVKPKDTVLRARELLEQHRVNQLPVVSRRGLVGIVTDRDLRDVFRLTFEKTSHHGRCKSVDPDRIRVRDVMSRQVYSLLMDDSVREASGLLRRCRIGAVPIVDGHDRLCGILTRSDLLRALEEKEGEL